MIPVFLLCLKSPLSVMRCPCKEKRVDNVGVAYMYGVPLPPKFSYRYFRKWCLQFCLWCLRFHKWCLCFRKWCLQFCLWCLRFHKWCLRFCKWCFKDSAVWERLSGDLTEENWGSVSKWRTP